MLIDMNKDNHNFHLEPVELAGINGANTTIIAAMHTLNTYLNDILNTLPALSYDNFNDVVAKAAYLQDSFGQSLVNLDSPEKYLPFIHNGAFKECYETGIPGWVIKYCSVENRTGTERQLLQAAADWGVGELFLPSFYIDLPVYIDSVFIEPDKCDYDENDYAQYEEDCDSRVSMNVAMLQPYCTTVADLVYTPIGNSEREYNTQPIRLSSGLSLNFNLVRHLDIPSLDWLQAIVDIYGDEMLFRFLRFTEHFRLNDLHEHNIGYFTTSTGARVPVLLDWLSNDITL